MPAQPTVFERPKLLLSHAAFVDIAAQRILTRNPYEWILQAFALLDADGKGRIEVDDLRRAAQQLGEGFQEDELQAMIKAFDRCGEGSITREEFVRICLG